METVNSINELPDDNDDLLNDTDSSTAFPDVMYSPQWNRKSFMKRIPNKLMKNNKSSTVNVQLNKQSSWCSSKLKISNEEPQSLHQSSSIHTPFNGLPFDENTHPTSFQSNQKPLSSYSSSHYTSSNDFYRNNPFVKRLKNPSVTQKYHPSYFDSNSSSTGSPNANFESFYPESSTTTDSFSENLESQVIIVSLYLLIST